MGDTVGRRNGEAHRTLGSVLEEVEWREKRGIAGIEQSPKRRWLGHWRDGELQGEGESCEWLGRVADDLQRLEGGLFIAGAKAPELASAERVQPRLCRP